MVRPVLWLAPALVVLVRVLLVLEIDLPCALTELVALRICQLRFAFGADDRLDIESVVDRLPECATVADDARKS